MRERLISVNYMKFFSSVFPLLFRNYFRIIIIVYHVGSELSEGSIFANFTGFWWARHEIAWLRDNCTFIIFEILLDVNSFCCMFIRWFVTKLDNLRWTENFLMACSSNFIIILRSEGNSCSNLLEGLPNSVVWFGLWQQNWVDCWSFLDRVRSDLFWSSDYSTFLITAGYRNKNVSLFGFSAFSSRLPLHRIISLLTFLLWEYRVITDSKWSWSGEHAEFHRPKSHWNESIKNLTLLTFQPHL